MTLTSFILFLIILSIILFLVKKWANGPLNKVKKDLKGKLPYFSIIIFIYDYLIILTGASDGIGYENAKVIFACRNKKKTEEKINELSENLKKKIQFLFNWIYLALKA